MSKEVPKGFYVEVHNSCTSPLTMMGASPVGLVIVWGTLLAIMIMIGMMVMPEAFLWIPVWMAGQAFMVWQTKKDPCWFPILMEALKTPQKLDE
jgi:type IV secretory pathway TrbD component